MANLTTNYTKLEALLIKNANKSIKEYKSELRKQKDVKKMLSHSYYYWHLSEKQKKQAQSMNLSDFKNMSLESKLKAIQKDLDKNIGRLQNIMNTDKDVESINISVEWKASRTWGNNPTATAKVCYFGGSCEYFKSSSIGGCGYDKESTAIAEALNQSNAFLKRMYDTKAKRPNVQNSIIFGYGSGYGILPSIEGGVGVSCYYRLIEKMKGKFSNVASGKTFDVYSIEFKK